MKKQTTKEEVEAIFHLVYNKIIPDSEFHLVENPEYPNHIVLSVRYDLKAVVYKNIPLMIQYPKTWWDAFKERWYPAWATKRWPIQFNTTYYFVAYFKNYNDWVLVSDYDLELATKVDDKGRYIFG